ncbi:sporulation protein [Cytobacillus firmus]|uniref:sporulation protein n=1 Tax=Cytobacillus firmus TaxID=1399 RepID=UPI00202F8D6C|nr:sporulation protein [Cytobacillus firmus]URT70510.1 sporulation protein [Cytobacillus firmus]
MILRKYMSMLGIGSAKIDLQLPKLQYTPGENVSGIFLIEGGTIEQQIKRIECDLVMTSPEDDKEEVIGTATILSTKVIESEETNKMDFNFQLPEDIPCSAPDRIFQFKTRLIFNEGVKSADLDKITIIR